MAANAHATIWYVDSKNGDDSNGGYSTSDALKTVNKALTYSSNGDTINVVGYGWSYTYTEQIDVQNKDNLTISAYDVGLGNPVITFSISGSTEAAARFKDCDNLALNGLHFMPNGSGCYVLHIDTCTGSLVDCVMDGDNTIERGMTAAASSITMTGCTVQKGYKWGARFGTCNNCSITNCWFQDTVGIAATKSNDFGHGVLGTGPNDNVTFTNCHFLDNGFGASPNKKYGSGIVWRGNTASTERSTTLKLIDCESVGNGKQGVQTQWTNGITINNGDYSENGATGIQIESGSVNVTITNVDAFDNCVVHPGEKGIWIDEASTVTVKTCVMSGNYFGLGISQSEFVTIDDCEIKNALVNTNHPYGGLLVNTGHNLYANPSSNAEYTGQPFGGVRYLTIESDCTFTNNGTYNGNTEARGDIWYGDIADNTHSEFTFNNNVNDSSGVVRYDGLDVPADHEPFFGD